MEENGNKQINFKLSDTELSYLISNSTQLCPIYTFKDHILGVSDFCQNNINHSEVSTASFDKTIRIYDISQMKHKITLEAHTAGVWTIDYANRSNLFISGGNDNKVIIWDPNINQPISKISYHTDTIYDVKFSSNDKLFASCSKGIICLWDVKKTNEPLRIIKESESEFIYSVNFLEEEKYLATGFLDGDLLLFEANSISGYKKYKIPSDIPENSINHLSKFKNGKENQIISSHEDGSVNVWNLVDEELNIVKRFRYFNLPVTCVNSSLNNEYLVASSKDHTALIWDINDNRKIKYLLYGNTDVITCANFIAPDLIATSSYDLSFRIFKLENLPSNDMTFN